MYFLEIWSLRVHSNSWRRMCFANQYSQWENLCILMDLVHFFDRHHIHCLYLRHDVSTILTNSLDIFTILQIRIYKFFKEIFLLISVSTGKKTLFLWPIRNSLTFSTAQTEKNLGKTLGKTRLAVWSHELVIT